MRVFTLGALLLLPVAFGQSSSAYLTSVAAALTAANLTSLVTVLGGLANTTEGMSLLAELAMGNKTVFAPNNKAFSNVSASVAMDDPLLSQILSYHILNNSYSVDGAAVAPAHTVARTLLNTNGYALPGNHSAPLVFARNSSSAMSFEIIQAASNVTAMGPAAAANLMVYIIDEVLSLPPNISTAATSLFPSLAGLIEQSNLLTPLADSQGITVFAPNNAAVSAVMSAVGMLNSTQVTDVIANHVINGSVAYSTDLATGTFVSAVGEPFTFVSNSTGTFVTSGNVTAMVVQSDIIIQNGVVHLIDKVLVNTGTNPTAAASAYSQGLAAASTSMDPTGAVTATSMAAAASGAGSSSGAGSAAGTGGGASGPNASGASGSGSGAGSTSASPSKASAGKMAPLTLTNSMVGGLVAAAGVILGGGLLLV